MRLISVLLFASVICTGCSWLVPTEVKREVNIMNVDLNTCLKEVNATKDDKAARDKAVRTLTRMQLNMQNVNDYMQGKKASRSVNPFTLEPKAEENASAVPPIPATVLVEQEKPTGESAAVAVPAAVKSKKVAEQKTEEAKQDQPENSLSIFDVLNAFKESQK